MNWDWKTRKIPPDPMNFSFRGSEQRSVHGTMQSFKASGNDPWDPATGGRSLGFRESSLRDPFHDIDQPSFPSIKKTW